MAAPNSQTSGDSVDPKTLVGASQEEIAAALERGELKMATREGVTSAEDTTFELVVVPEWDCGVVKAQSLSKGQQLELLKRATVDEEIDEARYQALCLIEGVAEPKFKRDDQEKLKARNARAFNRVLDRIYKLSAMGPYALTFEEEQERNFRDES